MRGDPGCDGAMRGHRRAGRRGEGADRGTARFRGDHPGRHGGRPGALQDLAQYRHLRCLRLGHGGGPAVRPGRGPMRSCAGKRRHPGERPMGVPRQRRHVEASARRTGGRGRPDLGATGQARLHRLGDHPGRPARLLRRRLPRRRPGQGHGRSGRAVAGPCDIDQALAVLPAHPPCDRGGDRSARGGHRAGYGLDDIAEITAETYPAAIEICDREAVDSIYAAKFSCSTALPRRSYSTRSTSTASRRARATVFRACERASSP